MHGSDSHHVLHITHLSQKNNSLPIVQLHVVFIDRREKFFNDARPMQSEIDIFVVSPAPLPQYATDGAAGADLCAHLVETLVIPAGARACIPTGLFLEIPEGYELQIRSRSGLALKHGVVVLNSPGTIDSDYRGEIGIILMNHGEHPFEVQPGMRIAQAVLAPMIKARYLRVNALSASSRGAGGFGHTGLTCFQTNTEN